MSELTNDLLAAVLAATPDRKAAALRTLRGEDGGGEGAAKRPAPEPFVSQRELARNVGLSVPTLWRYRVPKHELGGRPRFRVGEVLAYLESPAFKTLAEELKAGRRAARKKKGAG
jgi:hypothetical protein